MGLLEDMFENMRQREKTGLRLVEYGGIRCVVTGNKYGMIRIHPMFPHENIGAGNGMSILVDEYEVIEL